MTRTNSTPRESTTDSNKRYKENFEKIFGDRKPTTCRMTFKHGNREDTGSKYASQSTVKSFDEFVSPIDQTIISDRAQLREHNKRHGVTDARDYSADFMAKKQAQRVNEALGNTREAQESRVRDIQHAMRTHGHG